MSESEQKSTISVGFQAAASSFFACWKQAISAFREMERQHEIIGRAAAASESHSAGFGSLAFAVEGCNVLKLGFNECFHDVQMTEEQRQQCDAWHRAYREARGISEEESLQAGARMVETVMLGESPNAAAADADAE